VHAVTFLNQRRGRGTRDVTHRASKEAFGRGNGALDALQDLAVGK